MQTTLNMQFSSARCNVCFFLQMKSPPTVLACNGCNLIRYCSKEHQVLDWSLHKQFCLAVQFVKKNHKFEHILKIDGELKSGKDLERATNNIKCTLRLQLWRELDSIELEMVTFPKICYVCFNLKTESAYDCKCCNFISYCSLEHKQQHLIIHKASCKYLIIIYNFYEDENYTLPFNFERETNLCKGQDLFDAIRECCAQEFEVHKNPNNLNEFQSFSVISKFSCVATITYALQICNKNIVNKCATYFVVGATTEQHYFQENHLNYLLSQLPGVESLRIYFIGPEVVETYTNISSKLQKKITLKFCKTTFEDFVRTNENSPNLIACFNCGFSEFENSEMNPWTPGILELLRFKNIPILFTSFTSQELANDLEVLKKTSTEPIKILEYKQNFYKDFRPLRNPEITDTLDPIYFRNGYLCILQLVENK